MAQEMKGDEQLAASIVIGTTIASLFTLSAWIALFKWQDKREKVGRTLRPIFCYQLLAFSYKLLAHPAPCCVYPVLGGGSWELTAR